MDFCPSYRWKTGGHELSNKNGQAASWCDRILLHQRQDFTSQCLSYTSVPSITTSDHRPVYALFRIDSPVYDHTKMSPPFRIELFRVSMQLFAQAEPPVSSHRSIVQGVDGTNDSVPSPLAATTNEDDRLSQRVSRLVVSDVVSRDSQSAAAVYTLGIRGACIEGENSFVSAFPFFSNQI